MKKIFKKSDIIDNINKEQRTYITIGKSAVKKSSKSIAARSQSGEIRSISEKRASKIVSKQQCTKRLTGSLLVPPEYIGTNPDPRRPKPKGGKKPSIWRVTRRKKHGSC